MLRLPEMGAVQYDPVQLSGGFDQVTSSYSLPPGSLRDCINFACRPNGGYYRVPGYERFDGRAAPSDATFVALDVTWLSGVSEPVGTVGVFGGLTGTICYIDPFGQFIALTKVSGSFTPGNVITVGGFTKGSANNYSTALTLKITAVIKAAAANIYRSDIGAVPGSGPIRGVVYYNDKAYAFRDNVGATACAIYVSSASGWTAVALKLKLNFTLLTEMPTEGTVITQGGVTAFIRRTIITSGDVVANDAAGYFIVDTLAGGAFSAGTLIPITSGGTCSLAGPSTQITLSPGGSYNFDVGNFSGHYSGKRIYGADGVNDAFEFDGTVYVPIPVATSAKPRNVKVHSNHLFMAVESSLIHSALGNPYDLQALLGAGEIGTGDLVTGMLTMPGTESTAALVVSGRNSTWILYGTDASSWKFVPYNGGLGALERTAQVLFDAFALDDRGVIAMKQSLNYGNFDAGALTYNIRPFIEANRNLARCSGVSRENSQYRVFFSNGYGLYVTSNANSQLVGHGVVLFPHAPQCMFDGERSTGETIQLFGTTDGYIMQNDKGTSFDGARINSFANLNINAVKSPRLRKRFRKAVLELQGTAHVEMQIGYAFEWASELILPHHFVTADKSFSTMPFWDTMTWDLFFWDGRSSDSVEIDMAGTGENVQMTISTNSDHVAEFTLASVIFHYSPRRGNR